MTGIGTRLTRLRPWSNASRPPGRARRTDAPERRRGPRGAAELSVVVLTAALLGGVVFGNGVARTAVRVADGLTWLSDDPSGRIIQVNPATGKPEVQLQVGAPDSDLTVYQYDGLLYVQDHTTGDIRALDLLTLSESGSRNASADSVLLQDGGSVYELDREAGTITALDQGTTGQIGETWISPDGIADANIDGAGRVWSLTPAGLLTELRWSTEDLAFVEVSTRELDNLGEDAVMVAHPRGVTLFGSEHGAIVRVGTGDDLAANVDELVGELSAPRETPDGLVAVAAPESGTVVLVGEEIREVDVAAVGCGSPERPEVFRGIVYVPCAGEGRILRLAADGTRAGADIETPGNRDAELVLDDGSLFINVPGAEEGVLVENDGTITRITRQDPQITTEQLTTSGGPTDPPTQNPPSANSPSANPPTANPPSQNPPRIRPRTPTAPTATATQPTTTTVQASPTDRPTGSLPPVVLPTRTISLSGLPTPTDTATPTPKPTRSTRGPKPTKSPTNLVTPSVPTSTPTSGTPTPTTLPTPTTPPPPASLLAPSGVTASETGTGRIRVDWAHDGPAAQEFVVSRSNGGSLGNVAGTVRQASFSLPGGTTDTLIVTAVRGGERVASAPSNAITVSTVADAVGNITGTVQRAAFGAGSVSGSATWATPKDGGSAITSYEVTVTGGNPARTTTTSVTGPRVDFTVPCADTGKANCDSGAVTVRVVARNANGAGAPASSQIDVSPPSPTRLPPGGQTIATGAQTQGVIGVAEFGQTTIVLTPPAEWARFDGACSYTHSGNLGGAETGPLPCDANSLDLQIEHDYRDQTSGQVALSHTVTLHASNSLGRVDSARFTWTERQQVLCARCQIP